MVPNPQPKILEEWPSETPAEMQAIEQVSAELKSHMKHELIDHFSEMLQQQYGIKPKQQSNYFFSSIHEMKITDLTRLKQRHDETVAIFVQRFREVRNK
jgi:hypothetical protein